MPKAKASTFSLVAKLQDVLVSQKLLSLEQVQEVEQEASAGKRTFDAVLEERGLVKPVELARARAELFNMPFVDLTDRELKRDVVGLVPYELAENYQLVVFDRDGSGLKVALVNPGNYKATEAIEFMAREHSWKLSYAVTTPEGLQNAFKAYGSLGAEVKEALTQAEVKFQTLPKVTGFSEGDGEPGKLEEVVRTAPVAKMVAVIFRHAVEGGASDIHIEPVTDETRVRYRIDGILHTSIVLPRYIHTAIISRIKVLANMRIDETRLPQDGRIRLSVAGHTIDFRVSTMPLLGSEKVVLRILDSTSATKTFEELGFWGKTLEVLNVNLSKNHGMFLVTGPTGSGKSTTLYTALQRLNEEGVNIITLEDPVEYYLEGVNQSQVNPEAGLTFATGLRSILRQDPDIIMVGEIRDTETADLAIHASLTGHIVLSTLHTNDAFGAIPRFIDMHVEPFLLTSTINVIVAQRLVRRICKYCVHDVPEPSEVVQRVRESLALMPPAARAELPAEPWVFKRGEGCARCNYTGYRGRMVIAEALANTPELQQVIIAGANPADVKREFERQGMTAMAQDGLLKVLKGLTTLEEVLSATNS